jgi:Ca2+-binding RTX toxin-like protein
MHVPGDAVWGDDEIDRGAGDDNINGAKGSDILRGDEGKDKIDGHDERIPATHMSHRAAVTARAAPGQLLVVQLAV